MQIKYDWLKDYRGFEIVEDGEDLLFIRHKGIPKAVYSQKSPAVTEKYLKKEVSRLEKKLKNGC